MEKEIKSIDEFSKKYTVNTDICGEEERLETYGEDLDKVMKALDENPKKVWTEVDGDEGIYLVAGFHLCNRINYVITNEEWESEDEQYILDIFE